MEYLYSFKVLLPKYFSLQRWKEQLHSEELGRHHCNWTKWSSSVTGQVKIMCHLIIKRTRHHFCDIAAKYTEHESNHEKMNSNWGMLDKITGFVTPKLSRSWKTEELRNCSTEGEWRDLTTKHNAWFWADSSCSK